MNNNPKPCHSRGVLSGNPAGKGGGGSGERVSAGGRSPGSIRDTEPDQRRVLLQARNRGRNADPKDVAGEVI